MVCKSCGYINRDGVEFCRHCGIPLKGKSRGAARVRAVRATERYYEPYDQSAKAKHKDAKPPKARAEEEERVPRSRNKLRTATLAAGIFVIACVIVFCLFAFDILAFPGSGGNVTTGSPAAPTETLSPVTTAAPTVVSSGVIK